MACCPQGMEDEYKKYTAEDKRQVVEAGGLMVIGTERHESRRIDNQLRGRSGRFASSSWLFADAA